MARIRVWDEKPLYFSTQSGALATIEIEWEATQSGSFAVSINGSCDSGTSLTSAGGKGHVTAGKKTRMTLTAAELIVGVNTLTICLKVEKTNVVKAMTLVAVRDDTPPMSSMFPGGGAFVTLPGVTLSCSDNCLKQVYTIDGSEPDIAADGTILNGTLYSGTIPLPQATTTLKAKAIDRAGNRETVSRTEVYTRDFVPNLVITGVTRTKMSVNGYNSSRIDFLTDQPGQPYKILLDAADCSPTAAMTSGVSGSSNSYTFSAADLQNSGLHTLRICSSSPLGNFGSISATIERSDTPATISISPTVANHSVSVPVPVISCSPASGAVIAYSINGVTPAIAADGTVTAGTVYTGPLVLADQLQSIVRYRCRDGYGNLTPSSGFVYRVDTDNTIAATLAVQKPVVAGSEALSFQYTTTRTLFGIIQDSSLTTCGAATSFSSPGGTLSPIANTLLTANNTSRSVRLAVRKISTDCVFSNAVTITRDDSAAVVTADLPPGPYAGAQSVTLTCSDRCVRMVYTTDGSAPDISPNGTINHGTEYTAPIAIPASSTILVRAAAADEAQRLSTASFNYSTDAPTPVINVISLSSAVLSPGNPTATWVWNAGGARQFYELRWDMFFTGNTCSSGTVVQSGVTDGTDVVMTITYADLNNFSGSNLRLCVRNATVTDGVDQWFNIQP